MTSFVRFVNNVASQDGFPGSLFFNGNVLFTNILYRSFTNYVSVRSGPGRFVFKPVTGETSEIRVKLKSGHSYTLILMGLPNDPDQFPIELILFKDRRCSTRNLGAVRFIHGAASVRNINIWLDQALVVSDLSYQSTNCPAYFKFCPQTFVVRIFTDTLILWPSELRLESGQNITFLTTGILGDPITPFTVIIIPYP